MGYGGHGTCESYFCIAGISELYEHGMVFGSDNLRRCQISRRTSIFITTSVTSTSPSPPLYNHSPPLSLSLAEPNHVNTLFY